MDFLLHAIQLAVANVRDGGRPFASVIVQNGEVIATGLNFVVQTLDPTAHAEILAIREASKKLHSESLYGCQLYTTCEPCPMCLGAIYWAELDHVTFAFPGSLAAKFFHPIRRFHTPETFYSEYAKPFSERRLPMTLDQRAEAENLFSLWRDKNTKN
jgi:tRNA(Arg) A34 adenosine deaminase TadA